MSLEAGCSDPAAKPLRGGFLSTGTDWNKTLVLLGIVLLAAGATGATTRPAHHNQSSSRNSSAVSSRRARPHLELVSRRKSKSKKPRGQQVIQGDRARQIQTALIREGYLKGEPSGVWDQPTKDAMTRYQADHGWQTKTLPDSRALIKLGLGPNHDDAVKAETSSAALPAKVEPIKSSAVPESH
jgi:hypothetical protein